MSTSAPSTEGKEDPQVMEWVEGFYLAMQEGVKGPKPPPALDSSLKSWAPENRPVLEWRDPQCRLNLMQLAIVYGRPDMVASLASQFPIFLLEPFLYQAIPPRHVDRKEWRSLGGGHLLENSPLHLAARFGQEKVLRRLLASRKFDPLALVGVVTMRPSRGTHGPSHTRRQVGDVVEAVTPKLSSALHLAIEGKHRRCAKAILQHVIIRLMGRPCKGVFQCILKRELRELLRAPLLHQACLAGDARTAELILSKFPAEGGKRLKEALPVHVAIRHGNAPFVKILLKRCLNKAACSIEEYRALLYSVARCRFLRDVNEIIVLLVEFGLHFLQDQDSFATFALIDSISELSTWALLISRTPKEQLQRYERILHRNLDSGVSTEEAITSYFETALSSVPRLNGRAEMQLMGLTSMDLVLITAQRMVTDRFFDEPLLPSIRRLLECGFDPNVWRTQADLRHVQGYLLSPRPESRWALPAELLNMLCQFGWDLGALLPSTPYSWERRPVAAWLAGCCTVSWCTHILGQCDAWRDLFVESEAYKVLLNYMSPPQLRQLQESFQQVLGSGQLDAATVRACLKVTAAVGTVRSLQHACKLKIVKMFRERGEDVSSIDCLPWTLHAYLMSPSF